MHKLFFFDPFDPSWALPCSSENQLKLQHPLDVLLLLDWRNVGGLNLASMKVARHGEEDVIIPDKHSRHWEYTGMIGM